MLDGERLSPLPFQKERNEMTSEKKIIAQQKMIEELSQAVKDLEAENLALTKREERFLEKEADVEAAYEEFTKLIEEVNGIRDKYNEALHSLLELRKEYSKAAKKEISRIKRQV